MHHVRAEVILKKQLAPRIYVLRLFSEKITRDLKPGQFVHIKCGDERSFILRRPFSVHRVLGPGTFEILFEVVGKGTAFLAEELPHLTVDVIGPLGKGFSLDEDLRVAMLVGGGLGIAPLMFLASELYKRRTKIYIILGAKDKERLLYLIELKGLSRKIFATTEDGSFGYKGKITDVLPSALGETEPQEIFACGPYEMLKVVAEVAKKDKIGCQVSLEERMACGIGACLGCVCLTKVKGEEKYKRVCSEGPVFNAKEIVWK